MAKKEKQTLEERLQEALVPCTEWPYTIPENWCWTNLKSVCQFERGITFPAVAKEHEPAENNIPCLRTANVQEEIDLSDLIYVDKSYMKGNNKKLVKNEDIIMSTANSRELVGKVSYVNDLPEPMTLGGFILAIRSNVVLSKYLFFYLRYEFLSGKFLERATQTTNIANISTASLGEHLLSVAPSSEQQRIVDRIESLFSKLDEAKEKVQAALESFEPRRAAILHQAFTGELTKRWREENKIQIEEWKAVSTENACEKIVCGKTPKEYITPTGEIPYLKVYNIVNNQVDFEKTPQFIPREIHEGKLNSSILKPHDIIMNIVGPPLRKIAIIPDTYPEWNMNQAIVRFRPKDNLDYRFLYYLLLNPATLDEIIASTKGVVGQANISISQSRSIKFLCPSLSEQKEIVRLLESLLEKERKAKEAAEQVLEQIELIKKSILAKAFRGELGTNDPNEEGAEGMLRELMMKEG